MNSIQKETIKLYARQLKVPTFNNYEKIIRQLSPDDGYDQFLIELIALRRHAGEIAPRRPQLRAEHSRRADRRGQRDRQQYRQCPFHGSTLLYRYERHCPYSIRLQYTIFLFP